MKIDPNVDHAPVIIAEFVDPPKGRCSISDGIIAFEHIILPAIKIEFGAERAQC